MKIQYDYYTQTTGFPDVKVSLNQAVEIVQRFRDIERKVIKEQLQNGEVIECSESVTVWAEEVMNYRRI